MGAGMGEPGGRRGGGARARLPRLGGAAGAKARDARIRELAKAAGVPVPAVAEVLAIAEVLTAVDFDEGVAARLAAACGYGDDVERFAAELRAAGEQWAAAGERADEA